MNLALRVLGSGLGFPGIFKSSFGVMDVGIWVLRLSRVVVIGVIISGA